MAISIDTGRLELKMNAPLKKYPQLGERVRLEVSLPVEEENAVARCLAVQAKVSHVSESEDGSRRLTVRFRKPSFRDRLDEVTRKPAAAAKGWAM